MLKHFVRQLAVIAAIALLPLAAAAYGMRGNLVDAGWLSKNLDNADVLLLDASPMHAANHIPGAVPVDVMALAAFGMRDRSNAEVEAMLQKAGISPGKRLVMYDGGGTWFAPRLFFALQFYGFPAKDMYVLDGGLAKWQAEKLPVTKDPTPAPKTGAFKVTHTVEEIRARLPEFIAASGDPANKVLVDAMGYDYHYGGAHFFNKAGHIPNAVSFPTEELFNADKTFKSPEEMKRMLAHVGIRPDQEVHSHCGGGGTAAVPFFALKHIVNHSKVKLSVESQYGWLQDQRDLPIWTYSAPYLMRETGWLHSWGGKMMRMYGMSRVSVVDVRPAADFAQGHVPWALNVPADVFRSHAADNKKLAEALAAAGVNPAHEAVVISGSGITKEAALAYVLLEKIGQGKVSIFADSTDSIDVLDRMARADFAFTKTPTTVGPRKSPADIVVPAVAAYAPNARPGVTLAEPKAPGAVYPKVYLASGAAAPAKAPDGKVVHVPYTSLLVNGKPKPAAEIWKTLEKAGLSRYAEIVCISDDPAEAAANYFILKLMGFPDVKAQV